MLRPPVELISATPNNTAGNNPSSGIDILAGSGVGTIDQLIAVSSNGRYVAFVSRASDLTTATDTNNKNDLFVRDRLTGITTLVSVTSSGTDSVNGASYNPVFNDDGRYLVFTSYANNLAANDNNTGDVSGAPAQTSASDVFVRDWAAGTTTLVSANSNGTATGNSYSYNPDISGNGKYIAFRSNASDLVTTDTNGKDDIFVRDLTTNTTTLISINSSDTDSGNNASFSPIISRDGRFVVFNSLASDLVSNDMNGKVGDVFVRDLATGTTTLVSANSSGTGSGDRRSIVSGLSDDGRYVAFISFASNLVDNDTNGSAADVFVRDVVAGTTTLVSVNSSSTGSGNNPDYQALPIGISAVISGNGRYVAFGSEASNLVATDTNNKVDVFVRDLVTDVTRLVSVNQNETDSANQDSLLGGISNDGRYITFSSYANDLTRDDTDNSSDIFVRDLVTETTVLVSSEAAGITPLINESFIPVISGDGSFVAFSSLGSGLAANDTNNAFDVYGASLPSTELGVAPAPIPFGGGKPGVQRTGTTGNDNLVGTRDRDILRGLDGDDRLLGLAGSDRLFGGNGSDRLLGGTGNDQLSGGKDNDRLNGGQGHDRLLGDAGNDVLNGGDQDDVLIGGTGVDWLLGGTGKDVFGFGTESLAGLANADAIADFDVENDLIDLRPVFARSAFGGSTPSSRVYRFVQVVQVGANAELQIDQDGNGAGSNFVAIATLNNVLANSLSSHNFVIS